MKGDFSRDSFDPAKHFTRVPLQQGRVLTDADFNEQAAIQQHLRAPSSSISAGGGGGSAMASRSARRHGGGFHDRRRAFLSRWHSFRERGRLLLSHAADRAGARRRWSRRRGDPGRAFVAYLEVWERSVSAAEDPSLLDPALGGADTSVRAQTVWQARRLSAAAACMLAAPVAAALAARVAAGDDAGRAALRALKAAAAAFAADPGNCRRADALFDRLDSAAPRLTVRTAPAGTGGDAAGGYMVVENRLYRIEIHSGGVAGAATFGLVAGQ